MASCATSASKKGFVGGALYGCAIGDAMGRPTEFKSYQEIFDAYPNGIKSFADFCAKDFWLDKNGKEIAPYTDDTAMAVLVLEELIKAKRNNLTLDKTMGNIARSFVADMDNPKGWAAPGRVCKARDMVSREQGEGKEFGK